MREENKKPAEPMSMQKRTALLRYMAILFAVAFLLVLLSYLIQVCNSQSTITQLNATSASALQNAEHLQETNRTLSEDNKKLGDELSNAQAAILEYQEAVDASRQGALLEGRTQATAEVQAAYDLLLLALNTQDEDVCRQALQELEPRKGKLSEAALKQYEALKKAE